MWMKEFKTMRELMFLALDIGDSLHDIFRKG